MKHILSFVLMALVCHLLANAQTRHDANWVFGSKGGLSFRNLQNPQAFTTKANNLEANACISDTAGILQLYYSSSGTGWGSIRDGYGNLIVNGDSFNVESSATNGALFLPVNTTMDSVYFLHVGISFQPCSRLLCYKLYSSLITKDNIGIWKAQWKNRTIGNEIIEESIVAVKHSDNTKWWLFAHEQRVNAPDSASNRLIVYEIGKQASFHHYIQEHKHQGLLSLVGEFNTSDDGQFLFRAVMEDNMLYISKIDRCMGIIQLYDSIKINLPIAYVYGIEMVNQYLYVSYADWATSSGMGGILSYELVQGSFVGPKTLFSEQSQGFSQGQLEYGPDGNVWVSHAYYGQDTSLRNKYLKHLSAIQYPGTDTAVYTPYYFFIGDSADNSEGLPNLPNYNLGPKGVFLASAGKDTVLCSNTNSTGVAIGTPPVPNIIYSWQPVAGLSATNIAQPVASPTQSTWFYLTATDTTATSCAVNTDSVYVEVRVCTGLEEVDGLTVKVYPNPTNGKLTIELPQPTGHHVFTLYNLLGQRVFEKPLASGANSVDIALSPGIYLYQISANGQAQNGKLVME